MSTTIRRCTFYGRTCNYAARTFCVACGYPPPTSPDPESGSSMSDIAINLSAAQAADLLNSFASAERGREDFEYLTKQDQGDYTPEDIANARESHLREIAVESLIRSLIIPESTTPHDPEAGPA